MELVTKVYDKLPAGATGPFNVNSVYDGDTFTLREGGGGRRVRVLGVDCPEVKINQPYAPEAKQCASVLLGTLKGLNDDRTCYLLHNPLEREDRYGRELALVFCPLTSGGFAMLNAELLGQGLGYYYAPSEIPMQKEMLAVQNEARAMKRNIWSDFTDQEVVATRNGRCFHDDSCQNVRGKVAKMMASIGFGQGLTPCRTCLNDDGVDNEGGTTGSPSPTSKPARYVPPPVSAAATAKLTSSNVSIGYCERLPRRYKTLVCKEVIDGDTIVGSEGGVAKTIQLLGVNAPEIVPANAKGRGANGKQGGGTKVSRDAEDRS